GRAQAADGMIVRGFASRIMPGSAVPATDSLATVAKDLAEEIARAREAPALEDYSGPVLFEGVAAGQLLRELLSEALSGTPPPEGDEGGMLVTHSFAEG